MCRDLSHSISLPISLPSDRFLPSLMHAHGGRMPAWDANIWLVLHVVGALVLLCSFSGVLKLMLSLRRGEMELVLLWRGTSKSLGSESWASGGQNLFNGRDLFSNCSSGGNLGLISCAELYGIYHVIKVLLFQIYIYVYMYFCFSKTESKCSNYKV